MTPSELYRNKINSGIITEHPAQKKVIEIFDSLYYQFIQQTAQSSSWFYRLRAFLHHQPPIHGLYLWGDVGSGKTMLMNLFYETIPVKKMRIHFHAFMRRVHHSLKNLQGQKNPLHQLGKEIEKECQVLCLDEFMVNDIADAMILSELFTELLRHGICLITSSNVSPDELYKNGLQRERFLPVIALIKKHTTVFNLFVNQDYRLRHLQQAGVYYTPLDQTAEKNLILSFEFFSNNRPSHSQPLQLLRRIIPVIKQSENIIWFDFKDLCGIPRSQNDYLELIQHFHTFIISNIPVIKESENHYITSFINLIDVLYDAHARVIISAQTDLDHLYTTGRKLAEFSRTKSRLKEMQAQNYVYPGSSGPEFTTI